MEPNKLENQFREKLHQRAIMPTDQAWNRLDVLLTLAEKETNSKVASTSKKRYNWLYMAASFAGILIIASVFFMQTQEMVDTEHKNIVIEQKTKKIQEPTTIEALQFPIKEGQTEVVNVSNNAENNELTSKTGSTNKQMSAPDEIIVQSKNEIAAVQQPKTIEKVSEKEVGRQASSAISVDSELLLAAIDSQPVERSVVKNKTSISVNPHQMLAQADAEVEATFREKVIRSVNKKYQEVRVAIANRNFN